MSKHSLNMSLDISHSQNRLNSMETNGQGLRLPSIRQSARDKVIATQRNSPNQSTLDVLNAKDI